MRKDYYILKDVVTIKGEFFLKHLSIAKIRVREQLFGGRKLCEGNISGRIGNAVTKCLMTPRMLAITYR
jgi:hypothetical protein